MQMSDNGLELLKQWEGFKLEVYKDSAGLPTIGVGHLLTKSELASSKIVIGGVPVQYADGLTDQQVLDLLSQDVTPADQAVNNTHGAAQSESGPLTGSFLIKRQAIFRVSIRSLCAIAKWPGRAKR